MIRTPSSMLEAARVSMASGMSEEGGYIGCKVSCLCCKCVSALVLSMF